MLVVLDPALFPSVDYATRTEHADAELRARMDHANAVMAALAKRGPARVVRSVGTTHVWDKLYSDAIRPISKRLTPATLGALDRLRAHALAGRGLPEPRGIGQCNGARVMFTNSGWLPIMERVLFACALANEPVYLIVARILGRNIEDRSADGVELHEVTRFRLHLTVKGAPPRAVECVSRARHVNVPWSARLDARLPDALLDGARCPFCPPKDWQRFRTTVWRTRESRPCWLDAHGGAWARPRTGGAYHWDVYLENRSLVERIGLDQLNIVEFGAPPAQGKVGALHHVPSGKKARIRDNDPSWEC